MPRCSPSRGKCIIFFRPSAPLPLHLPGFLWRHSRMIPWAREAALACAGLRARAVVSRNAPSRTGSECAIEIGRLLTPEEDAGIPAGRSSRVVSLFVPGNCAFVVPGVDTGYRRPCLCNWKGQAYAPRAAAASERRAFWASAAPEVSTSELAGWCWARQTLSKSGRPQISGARWTQPFGRNPAIATSVGFFPSQRWLQDQPAPLAMTWNTNPSNVIPTATATIGSRISAVAFAPLTGPVQVSNSPTAQSRKLT